MEKKVFKGLEALGDAVKSVREQDAPEGSIELTEEERVRFSALLREAGSTYIDDEPYDYDYYSDDDYDINEVETHPTIALRRKLKAEGSKFVAYAMERIKQEDLDESTLYELASCLHYASSPRNSGQIVELLSLDRIAKDTDRTVKSKYLNILKRIATPNDINSLKDAFDKIFETSYYSDNGYFQRADAIEVVETLTLIKQKTTDPEIVAKINSTISYINEKIKLVAGEINSTPVVDIADINQQFEESFFDVELRERIKSFTDYLKGFPEDVDELVKKISHIKKVLEKYGVSEKLESIVRTAYWPLIESGIYYYDFEKIKRVIDKIQELSGVTVNFLDFDTKIQGLYQTKLLSYQSLTGLNMVGRLYLVTGVKFKIENEDLQQLYLNTITTGMKTTIATGLMDTLYRLTDIQPDFSSVEGEIQVRYKEIILRADKYKTTDWGPGLEEAEKLFKATGISPKIEPEKMQEKYQRWLFRGDDPERLILLGESLTGIKPDFSGLEEDIGVLCADSIEKAYNEFEFKLAVIKINFIKKLTGIEPTFNAVSLRDKYLSKLFDGDMEMIKMIHDYTGIEPNWELQKREIQEKYMFCLDRADRYDFDNYIAKIEGIMETTGIKLDIDQNRASFIIRNIFSGRKRAGRPQDIFKLEKIFSGSNFAPNLLMEIFLNSITPSLVPEVFGIAIKKIAESKTALDSGMLLKSFRASLHENPKEILEVAKFIKRESGSNETIGQIEKIILIDPWISVFFRIEKIQATVANVTNDPWSKELKPLLKEMVFRGVISTDKQEDAEILVSFIETFGMNNLPDVFEAYADCRRNKKLDELQEKTLLLCEGFGIKTKKKNGLWHFKNPLDLLNELGRTLAGMQSSLLEDEVPKVLSSTFGSQLFNKIKGSSQWEREWNLASIVEKWKKTVILDPEMAKLPPGFKESVVKTSKLKQKSELSTDESAEIDKLINSQEVRDAYLPLAETWKLACSVQLYDWTKTFKEELGKKAKNLSTLLALSIEELELMITKEDDPKLKQDLIKKTKALQNPKGRQGIENQAKVLNEVEVEVAVILDALVASLRESSDFVIALEALNKLDGKVSLAKEIRELSALHIFDTLFPPNYTDLLVDQFGDKSVDATVDKIYIVHKISKDYIEEHYLHHLQDEDHTEHTPFSSELLAKLTLVWQQQLDAQTGYLPLTVLKNKLDKIFGLNSTEKVREISVSMVPVSGLFNIFSGDLGDSCQTSQSEAIADGQFPNLRTWVYVTNRGKQNEELRGSVLSILSERADDNVPVLVVRANNPSENFIQSVDSDNFVLEVLREAVETAKRAREERIKKNPNLSKSEKCQVVSIPIDHRGGAATNRDAVFEVYNRRFSLCKKIGLENTTETNFNRYQIYDLYGECPTFVIWEIDEEGNETWHGNWKK
jgi:hypothetical protein